MKINLIQKLEKVSVKFPSRILKIKGYVLEKHKKEFIEILIYKGFSSSTTHAIEFDSEKSILNINYYFNLFQLFKAPLSKMDEQLIKESIFYEEVCKEKFWL